LASGSTAMLMNRSSAFIARAGDPPSAFAASLKRYDGRLNMVPRIRIRRQGSCQASAEHFQQCAEFPLLCNRGLGPLTMTVLPIPLARRRAAWSALRTETLREWCLNHCHVAFVAVRICASLRET
jgi:hypothetical protein